MAMAVLAGGACRGRRRAGRGGEGVISWPLKPHYYYAHYY